MTKSVATIAVIGVLMMLAGCGGGDETTSNNSTTTSQSSESANQASEGASGNDEIVVLGQQLASGNGCLACHSIDGSQSVGPTWAGLYGATRTLADGSTVVADDPYLKEAIVNPASQIVEGYANIMATVSLDDDELAAIIAYIASLNE